MQTDRKRQNTTSFIERKWEREKNCTGSLLLLQSRIEYCLNVTSVAVDRYICISNVCILVERKVLYFIVYYILSLNSFTVCSTWYSILHFILFNCKRYIKIIVMCAISKQQTFQVVLLVLSGYSPLDVACTCVRFIFIPLHSVSVQLFGSVPLTFTHKLGWVVLHAYFLLRVIFFFFFGNSIDSIFLFALHQSRLHSALHTQISKTKQNALAYFVFIRP